MGPNKNRFYVQNGKVYPLTDDVPAEIIISDDDDVAVLGNKFPIGSIAHNLADGTTFVLDPTYTWVQKGSGSNSGNATNGVFFINEHVDETDGSLVLDKTFSEIKAAIDAGLYPIVKRVRDAEDLEDPSDSQLSYEEGYLIVNHYKYDPSNGFTLECILFDLDNSVFRGITFTGSTEDDYPSNRDDATPIH